ncbi:inovirus Gp2 family protein [Providencia heimbachae]|uniref:inovirus Gp2 family protein n=1 Tax=Providencia TaxID=586 RepID=UPI000837EE8F|nr:inovirus Gp2 family protein [Providencia heimbachae]NIH23992.1 inovirus Gp2 family protein [Providencia heimbachae]
MSYSYNAEWLSMISDVIKKSLSVYPRTFMLRVDLRFPNVPSSDDNAAISRFIDSLKAKIKACQKKKLKKGIRCHKTKLRYIWVKEYGKINNKKHYHVILLLNKDAWYRVGEYHKNDSLAGIIKQAWCSALKLNESLYGSLVHFPKNAELWINNKCSEQFTQAMKRALYLAKYETKLFGAYERNFGCSQN